MFADSYIEALLWSSSDDRISGGEYPVSDQLQADMDRDATAFHARYAHLFTRENFPNPAYSPEEMAGHDFALTRNGHGAGFWDGNWEEPAASELTAASEAFGEINIHVGDDGSLYSG